MLNKNHILPLYTSSLTWYRFVFFLNSLNFQLQISIFSFFIFKTKKKTYLKSNWYVTSFTVLRYSIYLNVYYKWSFITYLETKSKFSIPVSTSFIDFYLFYQTTEPEVNIPVATNFTCLSSTLIKHKDCLVWINSNTWTEIQWFVFQIKLNNLLRSQCLVPKNAMYIYKLNAI